ncbi:SAM-dependent methyltransferase [Williamsia sterculiae]|uniref:Cyclopropane-fatty-acyl-phospholipid synthase n=1 Tax=Williamsia sterculiae TaxID=1344003 RepID=A0A1N7GV94_9NOCA|nr:cyclopropane-fatty-acyl-phospholipid synthase family protein [Williamsia sterculiae]SIS16479.1 cyclopropane-fatty-acyl-phospholipid synthase [Williamsia sterculiae]
MSVSTSRRSELGVAGELERLLTPIVKGSLPVHLTAWDGSTAGPDDAPRVVLRSRNALRRLLWNPGELGAAQAYVTGELDVEGDLDAALTHVWRVVADRGLSTVSLTPTRIRELISTAWSLGAIGKPLPAPRSQARLRGRLHSLNRDRAAISHHYDLSNEFYALILDDTMAYSSAYFTSDAVGYTIGDAQRDKLDLVCRKLGLDARPDMRFLDVGCGWGSLSLHAAEHFGARVVGVTLSREQKSFIDARIAERGLGDRVEIRVQDYREVPDPPFDAVGSIEMGEHVGQQNYSTYARVLRDKVIPYGRVLIQQMSRTAGNHPGGGPFIESFIAPDMFMRPVGETVAMIEEAGLEVRDVHALREHYVWTVDAWYATFSDHWDEVVAMVGEEVARVWRLYLVGGRMAFRDGRMGVDQILAVRPDAQGRSQMPAVRGV